MFRRKLYTQPNYRLLRPKCSSFRNNLKTDLRNECVDEGKRRVGRHRKEQSESLYCTVKVYTSPLLSSPLLTIGVSLTYNKDARF